MGILVRQGWLGRWPVWVSRVSLLHKSLTYLPSETAPSYKLHRILDKNLDEFRHFTSIHCIECDHFPSTLARPGGSSCCHWSPPLRRHGMWCWSGPAGVSPRRCWCPLIHGHRKMVMQRAQQHQNLASKSVRNDWEWGFGNFRERWYLGARIVNANLRIQNGHVSFSIRDCKALYRN